MPMLQRRLKVCATICIVAGIAALGAGPASAGGYYNLPGSFCQCFGYGYGAGYHACLVLGPSTPSGFCVPNEVRLPYAPGPSYGCYGYGDCGSTNGLADPAFVPTYGPPPAPSPAAMRPQILR
jgi:hypothetical protein